MSEDEYGLEGNRPIIVPCDAVFMDCILALLQCRVPEDLKLTFFSSLFPDQCSMASSSFHEAVNNSYAIPSSVAI